MKFQLIAQAQEEKFVKLWQALITRQAISLARQALPILYKETRELGRELDGRFVLWIDPDIKYILYKFDRHLQNWEAVHGLTNVGWEDAGSNNRYSMQKWLGKLLLMCRYKDMDVIQTSIKAPFVIRDSSIAAEFGINHTYQSGTLGRSETPTFYPWVTIGDIYENSGPYYAEDIGLDKDLTKELLKRTSRPFRTKLFAAVEKMVSRYKVV